MVRVLGVVDSLFSHLQMQPWSGKENEFRIFEQSVRGLLGCWSTLRLCVENGFGGPDSEGKKNAMVNALIQKYRAKGNTVSPQSLINYLYDFFDKKMNTSCEDGSVEDIVELMNRLCAECIVGDLKLAQQIIEDSSHPLESPGFQQYSQATRTS